MGKANKWWTTIKRQDWGSFLMQFFAVMLGIIVTFAGESIISSHNTNKEVKTSLQLAKGELLDNLKEVENADTIWKLQGQASRFLYTYMDSLEKAPQDSLAFYCNLPVTLASFSSTEHALDLMKSSGVFAKMDDKALALDIVRAYDLISNYIKVYNIYYEKQKTLVEAALTPEFKEAMNKKATTITAVEFWNELGASVAGRYLISEMTVQSNFDLGHKEVCDSVNSIISNIEAYCK
ncbi:MAG: hypothetical protein KBT39_03295 [Bacteroidales bacterium]|nr:hypothetical protein [Bacteroidales bacterium]